MYSAQEIKNRVLYGDVKDVLPLIPDQCFDTGVSSPPYYGQRDYWVDGQIGQEPTLWDYIDSLVDVFREFRRTLCDNGTLWLNLGDTYAASGRGHAFSGLNKGDVGTKISTKNSRRTPHPGFKEKDLMGVPWRVAFALQDDGWYLRQEIIWHKTNGMPESVKDRPSKGHETVFLFSKNPDYYYDMDATRVPHKEESRKRAMRGSSASGKYAPGDHLPEGVHANTMSQPRGYVGYENMDQMIDGGQTYLDPDGANLRTVWSTPVNASRWEYCEHCQRFYEGATLEQIGVDRLQVEGVLKAVKTCLCGKNDGWVKHFAAFPPDLITPMILAGCPVGGRVFDPFTGSGTTGIVARKLERDFTGIELNHNYAVIAQKRIDLPVPMRLEGF